MKNLFTTALVTAALALPFGAAAQERYPELKPEQLSPQQRVQLAAVAERVRRLR